MLFQTIRPTELIQAGRRTNRERAKHVVAEQREHRDIQREAARNHRDNSDRKRRTSAEGSQRVSEILAHGPRA